MPYTADISPIPKHQSFENNPYLKKHASNDEKILTFNQKGKNSQLNAGSGYSPESKKEILEQDEYQTEPRLREEHKGAGSLINDYEEKITHPSKALNFIKLNNQFLSKYEQNQSSRGDYAFKAGNRVNESKG